MHCRHVYLYHAAKRVKHIHCMKQMLGCHSPFTDHTVDALKEMGLRILNQTDPRTFTHLHSDQVDDEVTRKKYKEGAISRWERVAKGCPNWPAKQWYETQIQKARSTPITPQTSQ